MFDSRWISAVLLTTSLLLTGCTTTAAQPPLREPATQPKYPVNTGVKVVRAPNPGEYYPPVAKREHVSAEGAVKVTVSPAGKVLNVEILEMNPADERYGFAAATMRIAQDSRYENITGRDGFVVFRVKFDVP